MSQQRTDITETTYNILLSRPSTYHVATGEYEGSTYRLRDGRYLCESDGQYWLVGE